MGRGNRDFMRSKQTNELFDKLFVQHRVGIILTIPGVGEVRLRGDTAREFLWTVRSHKSKALIDEWLEALKNTLQSVEVRPPVVPATAPINTLSSPSAVEHTPEPHTSAVSMRGSE